MSDRPEPKWKPIQWPTPFLADALGDAFDKAVLAGVEDLAAVTDTPPLVVHKNSYAIPMSREMMLMYGMDELTPEEQAAMDARHIRYEVERKIRDAAMEKAREKLTALPHEATRAVLALHAESGDTYPTCAECNDGGDMGDHADWPCDTVRTIATVYGIEMP